MFTSHAYLVFEILVCFVEKVCFFWWVFLVSAILVLDFVVNSRKYMQCVWIWTYLYIDACFIRRLVVFG